MSQKIHNTAPSYRTIAKWVTEFKDSERSFDDAPRMSRASTVSADENIEALEQIVRMMNKSLFVA